MSGVFMFLLCAALAAFNIHIGNYAMGAFCGLVSLYVGWAACKMLGRP
jgi:hypothetical protein